MFDLRKPTPIYLNYVQLSTALRKAEQDLPGGDKHSACSKKSGAIEIVQ
jgi:hypothetical protein